MNACDRRHRLQDLLDGTLPAAEARALRAHVASCPGCSAELVGWERLMSSLARMPLAEPDPALTERILSRVVPARVRRRWAAAIGWGYAGALAAFVVAASVALAQPEVRATLENIAGTASRGLVGVVAFAFNLLGFAAVGLVDGWGLLAAAGGKLEPFLRAFGTVIASPSIEVAAWMAGAACVALLWWMRMEPAGEPVRRRGRPSGRPLGIVGF